jgi:DNA-binding winged helix-turn-helix (wHTH) protein
MMHDETASVVDLARTEPFMLGELRVRPATRELTAGNRRKVREPRVMQVLVALARRHGEVVSRDELIAACWGGRIVTDDAINRCVAAIRRATEAFGGVQIETLARVGYRLSITDTGAAGTPEPRRVLRGTIAVVAAALPLAVGGWWFLAHRAEPTVPTLPTPSVEVRSFSVIGDDPALRPFAARASDQVAAFLGDSNIRVVSKLAGVQGSAKVQLAFGGAVSSERGDLALHLVLEDTRSGTTLWSRNYVESSARSEALIDEAKGGALEATNLLRASFGPEGLTGDPESIRLGMRGGEEAVLPTIEAQNDAVHDTEQALMRAPNSGLLHAAYASDLDQRPGEYEVVRRVLGHKSLATTIAFYTGAETRAAGTHFASVVDELRGATPARPGRRRKPLPIGCSQ